MPQSFRSIILDEVGSTSTEAFARARAGEAGPLWIVARRQSQGRGRSGHKWASEPGNLYASLLQTLSCPPAAVHHLSLLTGVAAVDAIRAAAGATALPGLRLKWPNDILIGDAKCAGILPESHSTPGGGQIVAVIGVGINLAWHPSGLDRPVTSLAAHGLAVTPEAMLAHLAGAMASWLAIWDAGKGFPAVRAAWRERGGPAGETVTVDTGRERVTGAYLDLDEDGALILCDSFGTKRRLTYGEVTLGQADAKGKA